MLAVDDAGGRHFDGAEGLRFDGAFAVDGFAQGVHHTSDQPFTHRHGDHLAGALDGVAFLDAGIGAQNDNGNGIFLQILSHAEGAVGKLHKFAGHTVVQPGYLGDAVTDKNDHAGFGSLEVVFIMLYLLTNDPRDLVWF